MRLRVPVCLHLPVVFAELQQKVPPDQQEIFSPELVGAAGELGERPARLEYLVALAGDISRILIGRAPTLLPSHCSRGFGCDELALYGIRELA